MGFWSFNWVYNFLLWCGSAVEDSKTRLPTVKRISLIMGVTACVFIMLSLTGGVVGAVLVAKMANPLEVIRLMLSTVENLAGMVLMAGTVGYIGGKAVENKKASKDDSEAQE